MNKSFSLSKLMHDLLSSDRKVKNWKDFEDLVIKLCKEQDPNAVHNADCDPDVRLSNGFGIEAKSTASRDRDLNLNSASPDAQTYYVVGYYRGGKIKNVAIVSGANYYCKEIEDINKVNTSLRPLSNSKVRFRTRIMWQVKSPFVTWGVGNFIVDRQGKVLQ